MPDSRIWNELVEAHGLVDDRNRVTPVGEQADPDALPVHEPVVAILACSDARVPPSVVFGQDAGRMFVVRIAGNTASPAALASLDYAVAALGVELLVVMGHTGCGAVQAAAAGTCDGHLAPIVEPICRLAAELPNATIDDLVRANVAATVADLARHTGPVGEAARAGHLDIRGAVHDLRTGDLESLALTSDPLTSDPLTNQPLTNNPPAPLEAQ